MTVEYLTKNAATSYRHAQPPNVAAILQGVYNGRKYLAVRS